MSVMCCYLKNQNTETLTHGSPREAHDDTRRRSFIQSVGCEYWFADEISEVIVGDTDSVSLALHQLICRFTKYLHIISYHLHIIITSSASVYIISCISPTRRQPRYCLRHFLQSYIFCSKPMYSV